MDIAKLKDVINRGGGDAHVLAFKFGSGFYWVFNKIRFDSSIHIIEDLECVTLAGTDTYGVPFEYVAPVDAIEFVVMAKSLDKPIDMTSTLLY